MDLPIEILASLIASAIIFGFVKLYKHLNRTPIQHEPESTIPELVDALIAEEPKQFVKPKATRDRYIFISGTGSNIQIKSGGPASDETIKISGTGTKQTVYVSEHNILYIKLSGTGSMLRIDKSLQKSVANMKISGTAAEMKWV